MTSYVNQKSQMPSEPHWAIVTYDSIYIPGDERSRTHPGHGYPERYESVVTYRAFTDEDEWKEYVRECEAQRKSYTAMYVTPAKVSTEITVDIQQ